MQCRSVIGTANQNGETTEGPYRTEPGIKANNNWLVGHKNKVKGREEMRLSRMSSGHLRPRGKPGRKRQGWKDVHRGCKASEDTGDR